MDKEILRTVIKESNPWWSGSFQVEGYKDRRIYSEIKEFLPKRQIIALTGLRRVGKTTIMKKIVEDKLGDFDSERVFYFSFDEFPEIRIREVIKLYEKMLEKDIRKGKFLFLLDEIQKVDNWQEQLKRIYDTYQSIKFVISGSESLFVRKKSKESLAGRMFEFKVKVLGFKEYLDFKGVDYERLEFFKDKVKKELSSYLLCGGLPELVNEDKQFSIRYKKGIIDKIIGSDMPEIFDINDVSEVKAVFKVIYNDPGQLIKITDLAGELDMNRNKVSRILEYLEQSFLIKKLYNYSTNARKTERKLKKYYPTFYNHYLIESSFSKLFETFMVLNTDAEYFWRDSYKHEVDIVLNVKGEEETMGLEVKSGGVNKVKSLEIFKRKFDKDVIIVSYEQKGEKKNIPVVPFYEYLLG